MRGNKIALLLITFLLPISIFIFLKIFGKNEFAVEPLFQKSAPVVSTECGGGIALPYRVADSVLSKVSFRNDSLLALVFVDTLEKDSHEDQWERVKETYANEPVNFSLASESNVPLDMLRKCIFFLPEPFNLVLVDRTGTIRGQYDLTDREDTDRLITEIAIILKKY